MNLILLYPGTHHLELPREKRRISQSIGGFVQGKSAHLEDGVFEFIA